MAKISGRIGQPRGGKITVGPDERARLKQLRTSKGIDQGELAAKIGVSQATISNLESGRHPQMTKDKYAALVRVLGAQADAMTNEDAFRRIVQAATALEDEQLAVAVATIEALAALKKSS